MKRFFAFIILCAMLMSAFAVGVSAQDEDLVDSGIDYTESTERFGNPMRGQPDRTTIYLKTEGNQIPTNIDYSAFCLISIDMRMFSGGYTINEKNEIVPLTPEQTADRVKCNFNSFWAWNDNKRNQGGPVDRLLSDDALNVLRAIFQKLRDNGGTCLVRPHYAKDGDVHNEPSDFNVILGHVEQLSEVFSEYSDVIGAVEVGTIGPYGEMHTSPYCASKYSNEIVSAYLDQTPKSIKFLVRNPNYVLNYICSGYGRDSMGKTYLKNGEQITVMLSGAKGILNLLPFDNLRDVSQEKMKRLSFFNDGYMLTWTDTGTWRAMTRPEAVELIDWMAYYGYYGGEYGGGERVEDWWLPENALPEMYKTHFAYSQGSYSSYSSRDSRKKVWKIQQLFADMDDAEEYVYAWRAASESITDKDPAKQVLDLSTVKYAERQNGVQVTMEACGYDQIPFTEKLAKMSTTADVSAYYGYSVYSFIHDHMGYRFVIRSSKLSGQIDRGGVLCVKASIENTGFGNCVQDKVSQLLIVKDGKEVDCIDLDGRVDANAWYTQKTTDFMFECRLSDKFEAGKYDAYLRVCNITQDGTPNIKANVRFANDEVYDKALGANYVGSFTIGQNNAQFATDTSAQVATRFNDVTDHWAKADIAAICSAGYMGGTSYTTFAPEVNTQRCMLVQVLYNIEGRPDVSGIANPFNDVNPSEWYYNAVLWASSKEIVNGTGDGKFSPTANLTREAFATMVYRYADYKGVDMSVTGNLSPYTDAAKIGGWAKKEFSWAVGTGLISGMSATTLAPQGSATRAQMATILKRYIQNIAQ